MAGDPYSELGVKRDASAEDIQKAFRKLAKELHPDRNPGNAAAEDRFKRVSGAFDLLKDPEKRKKFDRGEIDADGRETFRGFGGGGAGGGSSQGYGAYGGGSGGRFDGVDLDDIFDIFGGGQKRGQGGGGFGGGFGGFGGPSKGADLKVKLDVDLLDAIIGNTRRVQFTDGRTVDVTIPKGAKDGQTLRLKGQGGAPANGRGPYGDALVEIKIKPHPIFREEGHDLHMDLYVSLPDAVLGGKVQAPTPDGPVNVTISKGSNAGTVLRLKGKGGAVGKGGARGDLFAHIVIALPDMPNAEVTAFAESLRKSAPYVPVHPSQKRK
ncbi:MAG: DnaJ C-terminal domain-containing protein [Asticcacaulis sp.]